MEVKRKNKKKVFVREHPPREGRGRPTKYKPEYCQMLIKHMAEGLSFECFGALVDSCEDTLYEWVKKYPEFSESRKKGIMFCRLFWEKMGRAGAAGKVPMFNNATWIFNMKNRFAWRDVQDINHQFDERIGKIKIEIVKK